MASITNRVSTRVVVDKKTGSEKTVTIERHRASYRDEAGKEHARHLVRPMPNHGSMRSLPPLFTALTGTYDAAAFGRAL
jgi:hypothetical protein